MLTLFTVLGILTVLNVVLLIFSSNSVDKKPRKETKVYRTTTTIGSQSVHPLSKAS